MIEHRTTNQSGLTIVETLVVLAVLCILVLLLVPSTSSVPTRAPRAECCNDLRQIGLSFLVWAEDLGQKYPMQVSVTNGGTMELAADGAAWRQFQVLSNELNTPRVLVCPADKHRIMSASFDNLSNSNISYFVGLDAALTQPQMFLSGDSNLEVDGKPVGPGLQNLWTNSALGWTADRHVRQGNIALADGSVQQLSSAKLGETLRCTGVVTNRLAMP